MSGPKAELNNYFRPESTENQVMLDANHFQGTQGSRTVITKYDPALPTELGRTYVVSANGNVISLAEAAGFESAEHAAQLFQKDPGEYNAILGKFDFTKITHPENGDTYVYFAPGSSTPQQIVKPSNNEIFAFAEITDGKVNNALRYVQRERSRMDQVHVQAEKDMHEAEIYMNDMNRVHYDILKLFGSEISDGGPENGPKNYTQKTISSLLNENEDYSYNQGADLSEDQITAITMLCVADPHISGRGEGKNREASAANMYNMIVADLYIERDGRHYGQYYDALKAARTQAKGLIDDFAKTKDPKAIAALIVESFEIATLVGRHNPGRTDTTYGNMQPTVEIDELLRHQGIQKALYEYIEANKATNEKAARFEEMFQVHKDKMSQLKFKEEAVETQFMAGRNVLYAEPGEEKEEQIKDDLKEVKFNKAMLNMLHFASEREKELGYSDYTKDEEVRNATIRFNVLQSKNNRTPEELTEMLGMLDSFNDNNMYFPNMKDDNPIQKLITSEKNLEIKETHTDAYGMPYEEFRLRPTQNILEEFININMPEFINEPNQANFNKLMDMMINQGIIPQDPPKISDQNEMLAAAEKYYNTLEKFDSLEIARRMQERIDIHNAYKENGRFGIENPLTKEEKALMEEFGLDMADLEALAAEKEVSTNQVLAEFKLQSDIAEVRNLGDSAGTMNGQEVTEAFREVINLYETHKKNADFLSVAADVGTKLAKIVHDNQGNKEFKPKITAKEFEKMGKIIKEGQNAQIALKAVKGIEKSPKKEEAAPNLGGL